MRSTPERRQSFVVAFLLGFFAFVMGAVALHAQDTTVVVDRTGLFGPLIDKFFPVIVTFLTSLTVKIIAKVNEGFARMPEPVKWAALYGFALLYNLAAGWLSLTTVDPTAPVFAISAVQMGAAALIFKFGQHRVPAVEPSPLR